MAAIIEVRNVSKSFETKKGEVKALENINLTVEKGELLCIVGASGSGKTTLFNLIAGFEQPTSGEILLNNEVVTGIHSNATMVFQQYALFPWKTVLENIEFGLKMKKISKKKRREIADEYIKLVSLEGFENSYPKELSGGMKQRVSIARALASDSDILLMDEPFGALDAMTRQIMQEQLVKIHEQSKKTIVFITHSIDEALLLSSRLIIFTSRPGRVKSELINHLPKPRTADVQISKEYLELKSMTWETVQQEVLNQIES
ncbi:ABC transporter ATP-binding protein [Oceanobacillus halophilus]|uniref:Carnitine transport ATP-binding protein OpuCA n=1 Tax=Oceanobacillus halophilus TaxID=930130 RepID=A0A495A989_9BACI|nr:ABC transporter ATP-binding protein [Oceanobacillus halophilus]RKQ35851.1 ABC transporter ATP-binding protein [Oceanobacillus halophilus]